MKIQKAFKFRLNTKHKDTSKFFQFAGCCRFVWNKFLYLNKRALEQKQNLMFRFEMQFWLTNIWKQSKEYSFLKDCHSQVLQVGILNLDKAFKDCFDKKQPLKKFLCFKDEGKIEVSN